MARRVEVPEELSARADQREYEEALAADPATAVFMSYQTQIGEIGIYREARTIPVYECIVAAGEMVDTVALHIDYRSESSILYAYDLSDITEFLRRHYVDLHKVLCITVFKAILLPGFRGNPLVLDHGLLVRITRDYEADQRDRKDYIESLSQSIDQPGDMSYEFPGSPPRPAVPSRFLLPRSP